MRVTFATVAGCSLGGVAGEASLDVAFPPGMVRDDCFALSVMAYREMYIHRIRGLRAPASAPSIPGKNQISTSANRLSSCLRVAS